MDASFNDLLIPELKTSDKWQDFADAVSHVFSINVDNPVEQIENLRFLLPTQGNEELQKTARLLGFDLTQDVLELSTSNMSKLVTQLALYYDKSGTDLFTKFIDLVLNAETEITHLYTDDYVNFVRQPLGPLITQGGTWYKTTHVELAVGLLSSYPILLYGESLSSRIKNLFYANSPISLVIGKFWFVVSVPPVLIGSGSIGPGTSNSSPNSTPLEIAYHTLEIGTDVVQCNLVNIGGLVSPTHILTLG
jgi:hypothetical protein